MLKSDIKLNTSKQYQTFILIAFVASLIIISLLPCVFLFKCILIILISIYGLMSYKQPIIALTQDGDGWLLHEKDKTYSAQLCGDSTITTYCCVLRFKVENHYFKRSCVIFKDCFNNSDEYRKFYLICKMGS